MSASGPGERAPLALGAASPAPRTRPAGTQFGAGEAVCVPGTRHPDVYAHPPFAQPSSANPHPNSSACEGAREERLPPRSNSGALQGLNGPMAAQRLATNDGREDGKFRIETERNMWTKPTGHVASPAISFQSFAGLNATFLRPSRPGDQRRARRRQPARGRMRSGPVSGRMICPQDLWAGTGAAEKKPRAARGGPSEGDGTYPDVREEPEQSRSAAKAALKLSEAKECVIAPPASSAGWVGARPLPHPSVPRASNAARCAPAPDRSRPPWRWRAWRR